MRSFAGLLLLLLAFSAAKTPVHALTPADTGRVIRLVYNVPSGQLLVYSGPAVLDSFRVSGGLRAHPTPRGTFSISRLVLNPWWHPPKSAWARGSQPARPGSQNPMGHAKLHLKGLYYIHGTPSANEASLGRPASHGCVRMANRDVLLLSRVVLAYALSPTERDLYLTRAAAQPDRSIDIRLTRPVDVEITYEVVEIRAGVLLLHPDVYGISNVRSELREKTRAEIPSGATRVNWDHVVERARQETVRIPLLSVAALPRIAPAVLDPSVPSGPDIIAHAATGGERDDR